MEPYECGLMLSLLDTESSFVNKAGRLSWTFWRAAYAQVHLEFLEESKVCSATIWGRYSPPVRWQFSLAAKHIVL